MGGARNKAQNSYRYPAKGREPLQRAAEWYGTENDAEDSYWWHRNETSARDTATTMVVGWQKRTAMQAGFRSRPQQHVHSLVCRTP